MPSGWLSTNSPHYSEMKANQRYAYISDIGASPWGKPIFITGATNTVMSFGIAFGVERWLRHRGLLLHASSATSTTLSTLRSIFTVAGASGLILLTIFDVKRHNNTHFICLGVFLGGYLLAETFMALEKRRLWRKYPDNTYIRRSFHIKVSFVAIELALAAVFGIFNLSNNSALLDCSVIVEWTLALLFSFSISSFEVDFLPVPLRGRERATSLESDIDQARLVEDIEKMCHLEMASVRKPEGAVRREARHLRASEPVRVWRVQSFIWPEYGSRHYLKL